MRDCQCFRARVIMFQALGYCHGYYLLPDVCTRLLGLGRQFARVTASLHVCTFPNPQLLSGSAGHVKQIIGFRKTIGLRRVVCRYSK
jgi:hypothetical protein